MTGDQFNDEILAVLRRSPGATAREIAGEIEADKSAVNRYLYANNGIAVRSDGNYRWYLHDRAERHMARAEQRQERQVEESKGDQLISEVLDSLRKRLLDLTSRNRLLNYRHPKSSSIRVIDELPDQLKEHLADNDKEMRFIPVPDPTRQQLIEAEYIEIDKESGEERLLGEPSAKEWAEWLGLVTQYEAPQVSGGTDADKHSDNAIQTMFFPDELETRLRSMRQKANSAIEETGANILYLALGFLEWCEQRDADAKRLAPLYLIPVHLKRGKLNQETKTYEYRLSYSGEDILTNISLREKLKNDFAIALPELEEGVNPEEYIERVADAVSVREPNWRTRRFITLCHLNFSKQLLYLDLDPVNWPDDSRLSAHPLVRQCLAGLSEDVSKDGGVGSFGEEHPIDDVDSIHEKYPLIDDADSSQHSALIDVVDGKNLVIEGPPGTGKSQTITNLIGAAISNGKKVLFVAEKSAALEVVKRRLDQAGLGAFCLELHSHRSQKRRVLDDIDARIKLKHRLKRPEQIEADIAFYEELKNKLRDHANLVNSKWKNTESSIHEILAAATRYRNELAIAPDSVCPTVLDGDSFTPVEKKQIVGLASTFATVYQGILEQLGGATTILEHPWSGVQASTIRVFEQESIIAALRGWQQALEALESELEKIAHAVNANRSELPGDIQSIHALLDQLAMITACDGSEPLFALPALRGESAAEFQKGVQTYRAIHNYFVDVAQDICEESLRDLTAMNALVADTNTFARIAAPGLKIVDGREARSVADALGSAIDSLVEPIKQTNEVLALSKHNAFSLSIDGIAEFVRLTELIASLLPEHFPHRSDVFDNDELDQIAPRLSKELDDLNRHRGELEEIYLVEEVPDLHRLREIESELRQSGTLRWFRSAWRHARKEILSIRADKKVRSKVVMANLKLLVAYTESKNAFCENADYQRALGSYFVGLDTDVSRITSLRSWYRRVRDEYGIGFGAKVAIGEALIGIPDSLARALRSLSKQGLKAKAEQIQDAAKRLSAWFPGIPGLKELSTDLSSDTGDLARLRSALSASFVRVDNAFRDEQIPLGDAARTCRKLEKLAAYLRSWDRLDFVDQYLAGRIALPVGLAAADEYTIERLERVGKIAMLLSSQSFPNAIANKVYKEPSKATIDLIRIRNEMLGKAIARESASYQSFKELVQLDESTWIHSGNRTLEESLTRNQRALENPHWLASWLEYLRCKEQLAAKGWSNLVKSFENELVPPEKWEAAVLLGASDRLAREILSETPDISAFSGLTQQGIQQQFQDYDDRLRELQRQAIAWSASRAAPPAGNASGRVCDYTELALLKHEIGKKTRHIPLRQLMRRAGTAVSVLKPCYMMGPMSVAQYLRPGDLRFDLVVMDEASQVRPEDAIGAVARGGQLVVVGDPKQLPPTSFFDKLIDDEDEQEDYTAGQQSESILDAALTTFPARRLRWHYRSQHESLIAFSNHAFYGSDLVIFPSPINKAPEYGIQFTRVKRGRFVNRVNREEAALIARAVKSHMLSQPDESIGVVAMSAQQREQIERAIEQETKEDAHFRDVVDRNQGAEEPLFVKNLENVQGDERDVIYISMTYGPADVDGKVAQRFGPINTIHGWRRLNVLFTRSKKRMHVFSSMGFEDIVVSPSSSRGVQSMKAFLEYAATGNISSTIEHTGRDPDSDFEVAVAAALSDNGFECVPQVGVAGYFLDIAVKDPGNPGRYLMAVECDGATYHSAKSTRDRDRLRQRILERLGWRVRRIWSTDWFNNPAGQLKPIVDELNKLKTIPGPEVVEDTAEIDEFEAIEEIVEELDQDAEFVSTIVEEGVDLRAKLERFDKEVIRDQHPETPPERRFLRAAMIDALLTYLPTTIWEFQQQMPPYLRHGTEPKEGKFIEPVLEIIYESGK